MTEHLGPGHGAREHAGGRRQRHGGEDRGPVACVARRVVERDARPAPPGAGDRRVDGSVVTVRKLLDEGRLPPALAETIYQRVLEKLRDEPIEDFRSDFEDGYGNRPDDEEDRHAADAAREVARVKAAGTLPSAIGIRIKPFTEELAGRSIRTLDIFPTTLVSGTGGALPANFVITIPKATADRQIELLVELLAPEAT